MAVQAGHKAVLKMAGSPIAFVDEAMVTNDNRVYLIADAFKSIWHYDSPITVYVNGEAVKSGFRVYRAEGVIIFDQPQAEGVDVTISGKYVTTSKVALVNSLSFDVAKEMHDITSFTDEWSVSKVAGKTGSGSFSSYDVTNETLLKQLNEDYMFLEIYNDYINETGKILAWVVVSSHNLSASVDAMQTREISFETTGEFLY